MTDNLGRKKWDEVIMDLEVFHTVNEDCLFIYESYKVPFPIVTRDLLYVRRCTKTKEGYK